jgi:hypothetical protein
VDDHELDKKMRAIGNQNSSDFSLGLEKHSDLLKRRKDGVEGRNNPSKHFSM